MLEKKVIKFKAPPTRKKLINLQTGGTILLNHSKEHSSHLNKKKIKSINCFGATPHTDTQIHRR